MLSITVHCQGEMSSGVHATSSDGVVDETGEIQSCMQPAAKQKKQHKTRYTA